MAFDVGHSSIGWAVLQAPEQESSPAKILGCGAVTFGADDCLASKRRDYRRQRRHTRSTRHRIARMEALLTHRGIFTAEEAAAKHRQAGGHPAPWWLAARVLASGGREQFLLTWSELWDVLRWYAHNRGYDGNERWSEKAEEALSAAEREEKKADSEREKKAQELMERYGTRTMAETVFADLFAPFHIDDPTSVQRLPFLQHRFKANQCAFNRKIVEEEVEELLKAHLSRLKGCDEELIHLLLARKLESAERLWLAKAGIRLPKRYDGGLLFGQLVPRFENRIIAECPLTDAKVPGKHCLEFLEFRWAMTLANIRAGFGNEKYADGAHLRPLNAGERLKVDASVRRLGYLKVEADKPGKDGLVRPGKNELRDIVLRETGCDRHNLDTLLLHPDAKDGLKLLPIKKGDATGLRAFRAAWEAFGDPRRDEKSGCYRDDRLRHRYTTQLLRLKTLTLQGIIKDLRRLGETETADRMEAAARREASDTRGKLKEEKLAELLHGKFYCEKLKGRAPYCRAKLAEAVQQVFHPARPPHPLEKGGCLEQTETVKQAALEKPLDEQTNNHLVRHRLAILRRLFNHITEEYAAGQKSRVARITVEAARDLQTMSGMTNKEKAKELSGKIKHHHDIAAWLAAELKEQRDEQGRPFAITASLIRKARIADDLEWECPYTGRRFEPADLVHRRFDKDHIIPRSRRLSDALEALVITAREVNAEKKARTALQFIKDMNLPENAAVRARLAIRTEAQYREFVDRLRIKGSHLEDIRRRKRRKELLLIEKFEDKEFTPADLTKTRHIVKLAARQLEAAFLDRPVEERPAVISITGAVTSVFRDRTWKLLPLLGEANPEVRKLHEEKQKANEEGRDFNLKKAIREVTHLHHALDAITLGLITAKLVPPGSASRAGLNGELARLIHKGRLTDQERTAFESLIKQLRLPKFYRWGAENRLDLQELDEPTLAQIRARLGEKRVVQHIPADMSGLRVEENTRGIVRVENGRVFLRQRKRDDKTGKLSINRTDEAEGKLLGMRPPTGIGRLQPIKGVRVISDNFGVAILDHAANPEERFKVILHHKVWHRIQELKEKNGGKRPRLLRIGTLIRVSNKAGRGDYRGVWMVRGVTMNQRMGALVDISAPDVIDYRVSGRDDCGQNVRLQALCDGGLQILKTHLTGIDSCPSTSSA